MRATDYALEIPKVHLNESLEIHSYLLGTGLLLEKLQHMYMIIYSVT